jgi:hypothetical protein
VCTREVCAEPSCDDSVQNGAELALDCGASGCAGCRAGTPCSEPEQCASGLCKAGQCDVSCAAGTAECDGDLSVECESQILSDPAQCGACAAPCALEHAVPSCLRGACQVESCETSYQDCNGDPKDGCEANLQTNPDHCGACNAACSRVNADVTCVDTTCALTCNPGYGDCDRNAATGCEKPTSDDIEHCGGCNRRCYATAGETPVCVEGQCETR